MASLASTLGTAALVAVTAVVGIYGFKPEWLLSAELSRQAFVAGVERRERLIDDHTWVWFERGRGPPLVLIHGFTGSKENWLPMVAALSRGHRVIVPDLPGWGESSRIDDADYGVAAQSARLAGFLDALDLRQVDLVGHSMGGAISGLTAAREPQRLATLTLMNTAGVSFEINDFARRILAGELPFNVDDRAGWERLVADLFVIEPFLPARLADVLIERNRANHEFHRRVMARLRGDEQLLLERNLATISLPTLVLWCDGDRVLDVSAVETLARDLPYAELVTLTGCGHMPMMERPMETAVALDGFIGAHRTGSAPKPADGLVVEVIGADDGRSTEKDPADPAGAAEQAGQRPD
jgi:pimeloyl-ACP methyl ester carboxylesterase